MSTLQKAIEIAVEAHADQFDENGDPYILHPLRVMAEMDTEEEKIVAVLHDVIEYTTVTENYLRDVGFSETIIDAIKSVTRNKNEDYFDFIKRVVKNEIGRKVKLKDLKDNMNWDRLVNPTEEDLKRMIKYQKAYYMIITNSDEVS